MSAALLGLSLAFLVASMVAGAITGTMASPGELTILGAIFLLASMVSER